MCSKTIPTEKARGLAIPICLGDFLGDEKESFRVVGTTPEMFTKLLKSKFQPSGEVFKTSDFATAVVGAEVARHLHLKVGDNIAPMHGGVGGENHMPFKITGILERTGTPSDRAAFVNIEGFFLIPDHARGHVEPKSGSRPARGKGENADHAAAGRSARGDGHLDSHRQRRRRSAKGIDPIRRSDRSRSGEDDQQGECRAGDSAGARNQRVDGLSRPAVGIDHGCAGGDGGDRRRDRNPGEHLQFDERAAARNRRHAGLGGPAQHRDAGRAVRVDLAGDGGRIGGLVRGPSVDRPGRAVRHRVRRALPSASCSLPRI